MRGFIDDRISIVGEKCNRAAELSHVIRAEFIDEIIFTPPHDRKTVRALAQEARVNHVSIQIVPDLFGLAPQTFSLGTLGDVVGESGPALSPDGRQVAIGLGSGSPTNVDVWTIDVARNVRNRVTSDIASEGWPVWSPDGTQIAFGSGARSVRAGEPGADKPRLLLTAADGTGAQARGAVSGLRAAR